MYVFMEKKHFLPNRDKIDLSLLLKWSCDMRPKLQMSANKIICIYIYIYIYIFLLGKNRMWSLTFRNISVVSLTTRLFFLSDVILVISHNLKILLGSSGKKSIDLIYGYGILSMIRSRQGGFFFFVNKRYGLLSLSCSIWCLFSLL